jgi:hypothetical protein
MVEVVNTEKEAYQKIELIKEQEEKRFSTSVVQDFLLKL